MPASRALTIDLKDQRTRVYCNLQNGRFRVSFAVYHVQTLVKCDFRTKLLTRANVGQLAKDYQRGFFGEAVHRAQVLFVSLTLTNTLPAVR